MATPTESLLDQIRRAQAAYLGVLHDDLEDIAAAVTDVGGLVARLLAALPKPKAPAPGAGPAGPAPASGPLAALIAGLVAALRKLQAPAPTGKAAGPTAGTGPKSKAHAPTGGAGPSGPKPKAPAGPSAAGAVPEMAGMLTSLGPVVAVLGEVGVVVGVAVAAIAAIPAALTAVTFAAKPFVQALSPSTVEAFDRAMDGLMATIGVGLIPIIEYARAAMSEWAGILLPVMNELRPVIDDLSSAFSGLMAGGVRTLAAMLELCVRAFGPLVSLLAKWVESAGQALEFIGVLVQTIANSVDAIVETIEDAIGASFVDMADVMEEFRREVGHAVVGLGGLVAIILKLAGANETLNKFRAALAKTIADRKNPPGGAAAAPKDAAVTGVEDISRKLQERAFVATSGTPTHRATDEILEEMAEAIDNIVNDTDLEGTITRGVRAAIASLPGGETALAINDVATKVADPSATGADAAAAARANGGGWVGAQAARAAKYQNDIGRALNPSNW